MGKGHCLVLEGESVGKRGLHTSLAHTAQMRSSHIQKPPKLRSIRIYLIKEAAKVGRLKNQNTPGCR